MNVGKYVSISINNLSFYSLFKKFCPTSKILKNILLYFFPKNFSFAFHILINFVLYMVWGKARLLYFSYSIACLYFSQSLFRIYILHDLLEDSYCDCLSSYSHWSINSASSHMRCSVFEFYFIGIALLKCQVPLRYLSFGWWCVPRERTTIWVLNSAPMSKLFV